MNALMFRKYVIKPKSAVFFATDGCKGKANTADGQK